MVWIIIVLKCYGMGLLVKCEDVFWKKEETNTKKSHILLFH